MKIPKIKVKVTVTKGDRIQITSPDSMINLLRKVFNSDTFNWTEEMIVVCLNRANYVIGFNKVASGGFSGVVCDPKVIMTIALQSSASSIILAHNHPSGNLKPSNSDIDITQKINNACKYLDINLLDHIILTNEGSTSLSELGHI